MPEALFRLLAAKSKKVIFLDEIMDAFNKSHPFLAESGDRFARMRDILDELEKSGKIIQRKKNRQWLGSISLPEAIRFPAKPKTKKDRLWLENYVWHASLDGLFPLLTGRSLDDAKKINDWLFTKDTLSIKVPLRERSLEIFGDEKYMDKWKTGLFNLEKYGFDLIGAYRPKGRLILESFSFGSGVLILENRHSWESFIQYNHETRIWKHIVHGQGRAVENMGDELRKICDYAEYLGDIDYDGLDIIRKLRQELEIKPLLPAYAWLLKNGPRNASHCRKRLLPEMLSLVENVLPNFVSEIMKLWQGGLRVAQEALTLEILIRENIFGK